MIPNKWFLFAFAHTAPFSEILTSIFIVRKESSREKVLGISLMGVSIHENAMHSGAHAVLEAPPPMHIVRGGNLVHQKATLTYRLRKGRCSAEQRAQYQPYSRHSVSSQLY